MMNLTVKNVDLVKNGEDKALQNILNTLDNISNELISRTDKLADAYKKIDKLKSKLQSKEDLLKAIMKYVNNLGKEDV